MWVPLGDAPRGPVVGQAPDGAEQAVERGEGESAVARAGGRVPALVAPFHLLEELLAAARHMVGG